MRVFSLSTGVSSLVVTTDGGFSVAPPGITGPLGGRGAVIVDGGSIGFIPPEPAVDCPKG